MARKKKKGMGYDRSKAWWWLPTDRDTSCDECEAPIRKGKLVAYRRSPQRVMCGDCVKRLHIGVRMTAKARKIRDSDAAADAYVRAATAPKIEGRGALDFDGEVAAILDAMREAGRVMSLKDVAIAAKLPQETVRQLLPILVQGGDVVNPRENVYRIGVEA